MPRKEKDNEDRMIDEYFKHLDAYKKKYGERTLLLWQCEVFLKYMVEKMKKQMNS